MAIVNYISEQRQLQCVQPGDLAPPITHQTPKTKFRTWAETTDKIVLLVQDARVRYMNPTAEAVTGYKTEESYYFDWLLQFATLIQNSQQNNSNSHRQEIEIVTKSGESRWLDCTVKMRQIEEKPALLVTAVDITKRHQTQAQSAGQTQLVSMLAHELRSPLNVISFSTSLLKRHCDRWNEEKKRPYLDRIQTAVEQLNQLMEEVLVLGKADAGKLTWEPEEFNLEQFCRELAQLQLSHNNQHNFTFISQGNCSKVRLDRKLLQPILTNLLDNAVKYSPVGSTVILELCCRDGTAIFQVKDGGIGIPLVEQQRLFEPFYRCENVGNTLGSGLGLAIVKKLVDLHGGQIDVASQVGVGSTFTVILPCSH